MCLCIWDFTTNVKSRTTDIAWEGYFTGINEWLEALPVTSKRASERSCSLREGPNDEGEIYPRCSSFLEARVLLFSLSQAEECWEMFFNSNTKAYSAEAMSSVWIHRSSSVV